MPRIVGDERSSNVYAARGGGLMWGWFAFAVWFTAAAIFWVGVSGESWSNPPGMMGDDVYFENIGWELSRGRGFWHDFEDGQWREPFEQRADDPRFQWVLYLNHRGVTTSRAPGYPMFVAGVYRVFGRSFLEVRVLQTILLVAVSVWLAVIVYRDWGATASFLFGVFLAGDYFVWRTCGQLMSEALGTALLILVAIAARESVRWPSRGWRSIAVRWLGVGLLFGVATYVRANLNAWFLLLLLSGASLVAWHRGRGATQTMFPVAWLSFVVGVIVVAAPWWIRSCWVTGGFSPFGTSGSFGLVGGYCDQAWNDFGNWSLERSVECQKIAMAEPGFHQMTLAEQEYAMGKRSVAMAQQWAIEHWERLPVLMGMKGLSHLGFYRRPVWLMVINGLLLFGTVMGIGADRNGLGRWVGVALALSLVTTMLTWPHYGRYSLPLRPLVEACAAIGTVWFWTYAVPRWVEHFRRHS